MELVSIIVPIYNSGEILRSTLDSIICQTYRNVEILLVDDGSKDRSKEICLEYANSDARVKYFYKSNGGICSARNYGLEKSHGRYVYFADHDDLLDKRLIENSLNAILNSKADLVKFGVKLYDEELGTELVRSCRMRLVQEKGELAAEMLDDINKDYFSNIWDALYNKDFLVSNSIFFDTNYKRGYEDVDFNFRMLGKIRKIEFLPDVLYTHYKRKGYSTSSKRNAEILRCLLANPYRINELISECISVSDSQVELIFYNMHACVVSAISYSQKLNEDISVLSYLDSLKKEIFNYVHDINYMKLGIYAYKIMGIKGWVYPILLFLYRNGNYKMLYKIIS